MLRVLEINFRAAKSDPDLSCNSKPPTAFTYSNTIINYDKLTSFQKDILEPKEWSAKLGEPPQKNPLLKLLS